MSPERRVGDGEPPIAEAAPGGIDRREAIATFALGALSVYGIGTASWERFERFLARGQWKAQFFTDSELAQLRVLVDLIIPRDERSGSATESGAVEYMDFVLSEAYDEALVRLHITPMDKLMERQSWHDGLSWLDLECTRRFRKPLVQCDDAQRGQVLDDIAWPARARAGFTEAAEFFNRARDLTAAAFFSSKMGVQDLGYLGNVAVAEWRGAPERALRELGLSYEDCDRRYAGGG